MGCILKFMDMTRRSVIEMTFCINSASDTIIILFDESTTFYIKFIVLYLVKLGEGNLIKELFEQADFQMHT